MFFSLNFPGPLPNPGSPLGVSAVQDALSPGSHDVEAMAFHSKSSSSEVIGGNSLAPTSLLTLASKGHHWLCCYLPTSLLVCFLIMCRCHGVHGRAPHLGSLHSVWHKVGAQGIHAGPKNP